MGEGRFEVEVAVVRPIAQTDGVDGAAVVVEVEGLAVGPDRRVVDEERRVVAVAPDGGEGVDEVDGEDVALVAAEFALFVGAHTVAAADGDVLGGVEVLSDALLGPQVALQRGVAKERLLLVGVEGELGEVPLGVEEQVVGPRGGVSQAEVPGGDAEGGVEDAGAAQP